jgi:hypothetical protein
MILLGLLAWICSFALSSTWAPVESWLICILLTLGALIIFAFDILDFCAFLLAFLLDLSPWRLATLGMFCNPSSGDLRPFFRRGTRSGFHKVHITCPQPRDQSILISLLLLPKISYFHILPFLLVYNPLLSDFAFFGYPRCGVIFFVDLFCRLLASVLFYCYTRPLHQRICWLAPLAQLLS